MDSDKRYLRKRNKDQVDLLKKIELPLHRSINVAIPLQLDLLAKHKANIDQYQQEGQWGKAHSEQINASRTLKQLRSTLEELELLAVQLTPEQLDAFHERTSETKDRALDAISSFLEDYDEVMGPVTSGVPILEQLPEVREAPEMDDATLRQTLALKQENSHLTSMMSSWQRLKTELLELRGLMDTFASIVHCHGEQLAGIEENMEHTCDHVTEGTQQLHKAVLLKSAAIPITGALIGGVLGGPLGLALGFKLAGAAGVLGGGAMGYFGGKYVQTKKLSYLDDIELKPLSLPPPPPDVKKDF